MKYFSDLFSFFFTHPIAKKNLLFTLYRYLKYQLIKRIYSKIELEFISGTKLILSPNDNYGYATAYVGLSEFQDQAFLLHFLRKNDIFIDIGSNIGVYSVLASGVREANSYSFEPNPNIFSKLKANIQINSLENRIIPSQFGIGKCKNKVSFVNDGVTSHVLQNGEVSNDAILVEIDSLDNLLISKIVSPTILKIDVEGYELEVLLGASSILSNQNIKAMIIELNVEATERFHYEFNEINNILFEQGFSLNLYDAFTRKVYSASIGEVLKISNNGIYIRDYQFVQDRINESPPFKIFNYYI